MNTEPNPFGARFAVIWVLANVLGVQLGSMIAYPLFMHGHELNVPFIVMSSAVGAGIGLAQGAVLFKRVVVGWILATAIGFAMGSVFAEFIANGLYWMGLPGWQRSMVGYVVVVGLVVGAAQGIVLGLRSTLLSWVIVNAIGYGLGHVLGYGIPILFSMYPGSLALAPIGLEAGLVTWFALRRLAPTVSMAKQ